jgi:peptidoglycan/LPS O-acetylase OafA/YrhL
LILAYVVPRNDLPIVAALHGAYGTPDGPGEVAKATFMVVTNVSLFGQDLVEFFDLFGRTASGFLLVPQAWSLATELWFYLLAPFLVVVPTRALFGLAGASAVLRLALALSPLPFFPWQQRLFPAELYFFVLGILAHRFYATVRQRNGIRLQTGWPTLVLVALVVAFAGWVPGADEPNAAGSLLLGFLMLVCVPFTFHLTRNSALDRWLGELSYPVYLWHVSLGNFFLLPHEGQSAWQLWLWSIAASVPVVVLVVRPVDRLRDRRVRSMHGNNTSRASAAHFAREPVVHPTA